VANKVTVDRKSLLNALVLAKKTIVKRTYSPIFECVKLKVDGGYLTLESTNLDVGFTCKLVAHGDESGVAFEVAVNAARFLEIVKVSRSELMTLESVGGDTLVVNAAKIVGFSAAGFPVLPKKPVDVVANFLATDLGEALKSVSFAVNKDSVRVPLHGIFLECLRGGNGAYAVASDGKQIVFRMVKDVKVSTKANHILSENGAEIVASMCLKAPVGVSVELAICEVKDKSTVAHFSIGDSSVFVTTLDGAFPAWRDVIPDYKGEVPWTVNRKELVDALRSVLPACTDEVYRPVLFTFASDHLHLFAKSTDVGEAKANVTVSGGGADRVITLNADSVLSYLASLQKAVETVKVNVADLHKGTFWKAVGESGSGYVLMPQASRS
jgi:DNA polymerase III sliding clamp (beta) subunit (PCNA family)